MYPSNKIDRLEDKMSLAYDITAWQMGNDINATSKDYSAIAEDSMSFRLAATNAVGKRFYMDCSIYTEYSDRYVVVNGVPAVSEPVFIWLSNDKTTVHGVTEAFINDLTHVLERHGVLKPKTNEIKTQ